MSYEKCSAVLCFRKEDVEAATSMSLNFECQKNEGHEGSHIEEGFLDDIHYKLTWQRNPMSARPTVYNTAVVEELLPSKELAKI